MRKSIKSLTLYIISLSVTFSLFVVSVVFNMIVTFNRDIYGESTRLVMLSSFLASVLFGFVLVLLAKLAYDHKLFIDHLRLENLYTLGQETSFYNMNAFKARAIKLRKSRFLAKKEQYIVAFSVSSSEVAMNSYENDDINKLNFHISEFLTNYFEVEHNLGGKNYNVYGFSRGVFLILCFVKNEDEVHKLVQNISNEIYNYVEEEQLKVWAQPFYGVRKLVKEDNLTAAVEDALIARSASESNFESYTFFQKNGNSNENAEFLKEIEDALKNNEFVPFYQPKYSVKQKKFISSEVLARWNSPKRGLMSPGMFIDKAESFGLLSQIDIYIFERALMDLSDSIRRGRRVIPVSCNFSLYEFFSRSFLDTVNDLLQKYQVPPSLVEIEITESTSQVNQFLSVSVIKKLKDQGIRVLMDDYGVGYSQIQNLKNIPFDAIKIDKSFSDLLLTDEKTKSIVKLLIDLGHTNDLEVIIEGVEKKEQVDLLKKMKIDTIQGFYYSKPLSTKDYEAFLKDNEFERSGDK